MQTAVTDLSTSKVTVTGTMEANKLVDYVYRRTKKIAKIVPQPEPEPAKVEEKPAEEAKPAEEKKEEEKAEEKPADEAKKEGEGGENPEKNEKKEDEGQKEVVENNDIVNTDEENMKRMMHYYDQPLYVIERIPPPQLFSDENPNACCIS